MRDTPAARIWVWFEQLGQDVRIALRTIRRDAVFAFAAVSTLALGIGATTAIFGTANAALLRPLPYPDGVIAYASAERRSEVATRMALGASPSNVFWLLVREGRALALVGAVLGAATAFATGRLASNWLFEVQASDRLVLPIALALVLGVTIVAILIPARRASRTSPAYALTSE